MGYGIDFRVEHGVGHVPGFWIGDELVFRVGLTRACVRAYGRLQVRV